MCNYRQLNTGAGVMCGWCLAYYTGVVRNTVRESATPDSKENKQADAGSRRFRRRFLCGALLRKFSPIEHEGLSTHVQRECSAEPFMRSVLSLRLFTSRPGSGLRFFIKMQIQYSYYNSTLLYSRLINGAPFSYRNRTPHLYEFFCYGSSNKGI